MSLTRKHYVMLADGLKEARPTNGDRYDLNGWMRAVSAVADVLETDNPAFDRARFIKAAQGDKE